jgi:hypothetical protein
MFVKDKRFSLPRSKNFLFFLLGVLKNGPQMVSSRQAGCTAALTIF